MWALLELLLKIILPSMPIKFSKYILVGSINSNSPTLTDVFTTESFLPTTFVFGTVSVPTVVIGDGEK